MLNVHFLKQNNKAQRGLKNHTVSLFIIWHTFILNLIIQKGNTHLKYIHYFYSNQNYKPQ